MQQPTKGEARAHRVVSQETPDVLSYPPRVRTTKLRAAKHQVGKTAFLPAWTRIFCTSASRLQHVDHPRLPKYQNEVRRSLKVDGTVVDRR